MANRWLAISASKHQSAPCACSGQRVGSRTGKCGEAGATAASGAERAGLQRRKANNGKNRFFGFCFLFFVLLNMVERHTGS